MRSEYYREHFEWDKEAQTEFKVSFAPVRAGVAGTVERFTVADGGPVEGGQVVAWIRP